VGVTAAAGFLAVAALAVFGLTQSGATQQHAAPAVAKLWPEDGRPGETRLAGQVPLSISTPSAKLLGGHAASDILSLNFGLPITDKGGLNLLIDQEARTHRYLTRDQLYARFSPPVAQFDALRGWLQRNGFTITHVGADRLSIGAKATTAQVERALHVKLNDYVRSGYTFDRKVKVKPYVFYANTTAPQVPAGLGIQSISGLSNVDRFFTAVQLGGGVRGAARDCGDDDTGPVNPLCVDVRSGGYFPSDLRSLYDITGHGYDATGQTIGFTLWTAPEHQAAMTTYASTTGDQLITIVPSCAATGNSPTVPSTCTTATVSADQLMFVLENGNTDANSNFNSNVETALDIEAAHGIATHAGLKYYASECSPIQAGSGESDAGCDGSDVGLEDALEDAANDPTLHSVSNSWAFGGEAEWGNADPFVIASQNSLSIAAAAGTTFYFSTGDSGTYQSGYPSDSPYVVAVGGTSTYSTGTPSTWSTTTTWSGGGSWCSNIIGRPSWQNIAAVNAAAPCPGRAIPDVSTVADPNTGIRFVDTTSATTTGAGQVGGTSLAAPVMNGLEAVTANFVKAQTYPGATPALGFVAPVLYQLGNSGHYSSYFRDVQCGNTASPTSGPDGDAAGAGWDPATGWGEPDWFNFATGYALQLGATNLAVPASLSQGFGWSCAKTPSNSSERGISCATTSVCYAVGAASGNTPWPAKFMPSGAWGAVNTFFKSTDGGATWFPSNSDMLSVACTSSSSCVEVGDGGRARATADGGTTWTEVSTGFNKALTQVTCPSSSICYAAGDRGVVLKSTDGGQTWSYLMSTDGNPIYGLTCPDTQTCYTSDIYGHVIKTANGGATWTWQSTPITTPGVNVPGSGGPNPFGGLMSISCSSDTTCVATGLYVVVSGQTLPKTDPPIVTTTDGGATWTLRTSNAGGAPVSTTLSAAAVAGATNIKVASVANFVAGQAMTVDSGVNAETVTIGTVGTAGATGTGVTFSPPLTLAHASGVSVTTTNANSPNFLHAVSCVPGTQTCTAVGRGGAIVTTTNLTTWTKQASGTINMLNSVDCLSATFCMASGQNGTTDVWNGSSWTATTGNGGGVFLSGVTCLSTTTCFAAGKQGVTIATTNGGATWTQQAGGGTTAQMNSVSCPTVDTCFAVGNGSASAPGTILKTTNGGQMWFPALNGITVNLTGISCTSAFACSAVGASGATYYSTGSSFSPGVSGTTNGLNGVACVAGGSCTAVGASGTILVSADGGATWTADTSGTTIALNAVSCPSVVCYTTGAVSSGSAVLLKTVDGTTWMPQTSHSPQALSGISCLDAENCFAGGAIGTLVTTTDGSTWAQQGDPLSGPTTALNATSSTGLALNAATCTWSRCLMGSGAQADIMDSPLLTVTVNVKTRFGTTPNLTGLLPSSAFLAYSPAAQAANVTGTLTCSTTATNGSPTGPWPITACSGLADPGFSVVYDYADSADTVVTGSQTINFGPLPDKTFGDRDFTVSATATSGLTVTFSATGSCTVSGTTVHITHAGSCSIKASQAGDSVYDAAQDVSQSFNIAQAAQLITFAAINDQTFGTADFGISATSTSGLPVTLGASGPCTLTATTSPANVHITGAGSCTITASQAGNTDYKPAADVPRSFNIAMEDQTITFASIAAHTFGDPDFVISPSASSGLTVSLQATGDCSLSGTTVHITGAGSCSIKASQAGNANYNPAPDVTQGFSIAMESQTITFTTIPTHTFGDADFTVSPIASSGLAVSTSVGPTDNCTDTAGVIHITGAGSCSVTATQAGDANWSAAAPVTQMFTINPGNQTITFAAIPGHTFGDADFAIDPVASSGLTVSLTTEAGSTCQLIGLNVHITGAGGCSIDANQAGNTNWNPAPKVTQTFAIAKEGQTITFPAIADQVLGAPDFEIAANDDSRLPITFSVVSGPCTTAPGSSDYAAIVHLTGAGTCMIKASQAGDSNWLAAADVTQSFQITGSSKGSAVGGGLKPTSGGNAAFDVNGNGSGGVTGTLNWVAPPSTPTPGVKSPPKADHLESASFTTFAISPDGKSAWFSGVAKDGRTFTVYVEDNSGSGHGQGPQGGPKAKPDLDVFELWINGVLVTGDGSLTGGKVTISANH
jgi:photosystem II stability/assembly factor-like uncharacterized protein